MEYYRAESLSTSDKADSSYGDHQKRTNGLWSPLESFDVVAKEALTCSDRDLIVVQDRTMCVKKNCNASKLFVRTQARAVRFNIIDSERSMTLENRTLPRTALRRTKSLYRQLSALDIAEEDKPKSVRAEGNSLHGLEIQKKEVTPKNMLPANKPEHFKFGKNEKGKNRCCRKMEGKQCAVATEHGHYLGKYGSDVSNDEKEAEDDGGEAELGQLTNRLSLLRISQSGEKEDQKEGREKRKNSNTRNE